MVAFSVIPPNLRVPGVWFEVSNNANTATILQNTLLIGQSLPIGTATPDIPVLVGTLRDAASLFGVDSMLYSMFKQYQGEDPFGTIFCLPLVDSEAGVAATGTITFSGTVSASGTLSLYVGGQLVPVGVSAAASPTAIAANVATAINAMPAAPFSATAALGVVTITATHAGIAAGDIDLRLNYRGTSNAEVTPAGLTVVIVPMSGGTEDPDITVALSNLGTINFDFIVQPYNGSANLEAAATFIGDLTGRWSFLQQSYGGLFSAINLPYSALATFGQTNNNQHLSIIGIYDTPTPAYLVACSYAGACASSLRVNPSIPVGGAGAGVLMQGVLAPPLQSQFSIAEQQTLLYDGISTYFINQDNSVRVSRAITTYQVNQAGLPDNGYLDLNVPYQLMYALRGYWTFYSSNYGRCALVADGNQIPFGNPAVMPMTIKAGTIGFYKTLCNQGICQNADMFNQTVQVLISSADTISVYLPLDLSNQLIDITVLAAFNRNN